MIYVALTIISIVIWYQFTFPQLCLVQNNIDRPQALENAKVFIQYHYPDMDIEDYSSASIFEREWVAIRYLQKTLGFKSMQQFVKENNFDLFFWVVRFFKENQKEEFRLSVSATTGQVIAFKHTIDNNAARGDIETTVAQQRIISFFEDQFDFESGQYSPKGDYHSILDNRTDRSYSWKKNSVNIPWSSNKNTGTAKLYSSATISGQEILSFAKNTFEIPEQFNRYLSRSKVIGQNLSMIVKIFISILFFGAVLTLMLQHNHLAMHTTKKFYMVISACAFIMIIGSSLNYFEAIIFSYPTTEAFDSFISRYFLSKFMPALILAVSLLMPGLSGELLHYEQLQNKKEGSFLSYIHSSFFTRPVGDAIILGYLGCFCMLGMQSLISFIGQKYWGVWIEYYFLTNLSTSYIPFLAALAIGFNASFSEEIMYRLFAISWGKKLFKSTFLAAFVASLIWGFAHSGYPVFPMWFRGVEVTLLGLFLSYIYLKHGIITVLVTHYLFDVFWNTSSFLFGTTVTQHFVGAWFVLLLPAIFASICYIKNKKVDIRPLQWNLNKHQKFNLEVLKAFIRQHLDSLKTKDVQIIKKEIIQHGWDVAVVEMAIKDVEQQDNS
ncbi:MAG: CPBP family intramembrane metalloprotease [Candidatus Omnitrophica bacterium]|nr:CPBP family intramembrane metalloprotease [Candidatus Omnitrophota bacterium]